MIYSAFFFLLICEGGTIEISIGRESKSNHTFHLLVINEFDFKPSQTRSKKNALYIIKESGTLSHPEASTPLYERDDVLSFF